LEYASQAGNMNKDVAKLCGCFQLAAISRNPFIIITYNKTIFKIVTILYEKGFINSFSIKNNKDLLIHLKFVNGKPLIKEMKFNVQNIEKEKLRYLLFKQYSILVNSTRGLSIIRNFSSVMNGTWQGKVLLLIKT